MIRNPQFDTRRTTHSAAYWAEELVHMRECYVHGSPDEWAEYGGLHCLRTDIELLRNDLNNGEIT